MWLIFIPKRFNTDTFYNVQCGLPCCFFVVEKEIYIPSPCNTVKCKLILIKIINLIKIRGNKFTGFHPLAARKSIFANTFLRFLPILRVVFQHSVCCFLTFVVCFYCCDNGHQQCTYGKMQVRFCTLQVLQDIYRLLNRLF